MPPRGYVSAAIASPMKAAKPPAKIEVKRRNPPPSESNRGTSDHFPASPSDRRGKMSSHGSSTRTRIPPPSIVGRIERHRLMLLQSNDFGFLTEGGDHALLDQR